MPGPTRRRLPVLLGPLLVVLSNISSTAAPAWADAGTTTRVSVNSAGSQANSFSQWTDVSGDGRYVAFASYASNLVPGDTNGLTDIFVHDRHSGATSRVNVSSSGVEANASSGNPSVSADGRYVAFSSSASNLVAGDTNSAIDIFVHDRHSGATSRVNVRSPGVEADAGAGGSRISADGRYVAFHSSASNLVDGDTNGVQDVFVHDRDTGATSRVSMSSSGAELRVSSTEPAISADGRYVAFQSTASNLVGGDTNGTADIFLHDRGGGATTRVSVGSSGEQANGHSVLPAISADGRHVSFGSSAPNLVPGDSNGKVDVFVHDVQSGTTSRVSIGSSGTEPNNVSVFSRLSADGRYVSFDSNASNLVAGDTNSDPDVFVHDRHTGMTTRVSVSSSGTGGNEGSMRPDISDDGQLVTFWSSASNLVPDDTNDQSDVFVHELSNTTTPPADTTPPAAPTVSLTDPVNAANQTTVTVSGTGEAGTKANISVDDQDPTTAAVTGSVTVSETGYSATLDLSSLSDGTLTATVTLTDAAGNTGAVGADTATKDTLVPDAPTVELAERVNPGNETAVSVSGTGEAGATAAISIDDEDPATAAVTATAQVSASGYSTVLDLSGLSRGVLTATVTVTDSAGNTGPASSDTATKVGPPVDPSSGPARP